MDRRTARTRKALRAALLSLLRRKSYDDVTVQDIIDAADVGRSTFYLHCSGKEDLLRLGLQTLGAELENNSDRPQVSAGDTITFSLKMLQHVADHRHLYPSLGRGRGRDVWMREMRQVVLGLMRQDLDAIGYDVSVPRELAEQHIAGGFMSVLLWWLERRASYSPAQIDAIFQRLVLRGIASSSK